MADVHLRHINYVNIKVVAEPGIVMELADHFTWYAEGYKWSPKYKMGYWDGKIRLVNQLTGIAPAGLAQRIKRFCDSRGYSFSFDDELCYEDVSEYELQKFMESLNIPEKFESRDYQFKSILKCLRSNRRLLLSPTSSGKSLMIYVLTRWYQEKYGAKALIIVPTVGLVTQMYDDFRDYGYKGTAHLSTDGLSKDNDIPADLVITTWQSLNNGKTKKPKAWYQQFGMVIGDEAHTSKALLFKSIMETMEHVKFRFGTTGTLDDSQLNQATIEGAFGAQFKVVSTKQLMQQDYVSKLKIKCIVLKYPEDKRKLCKKATYQEELDFITSYTGRTEFIKNLALSLKGNKLVFFRYIDHGKDLYSALVKENDKVYYIDGSVGGADRDDIRKTIESEDDAILLASLGTTSTGVSIKRLHHMIAATPSKSKIKVLQSIGRMLRQHETKYQAILYDLVDDLQYKGRENYTLRHFQERLKIYDHEQFDYTIYTVKLK